jgi:hypothetical protein
MDAMLALEPARASAQAPQSADEPEEEEEEEEEEDDEEELEQDVPLLKRQLLGIIRDAKRHIALGRVRLQPPETRRHLLDRVHQLQAQYDDAMHHRMPIMLHACASLLHMGLSAPFPQSNLMALFRVARTLVRKYDSDYRTRANDNDIRFCLSDLLAWTWYKRFVRSDVELHQMLCVLTDLFRDILDGVSPLLRNRYMPVVHLLEAAQRYYLGIDMRQAIDRAGRLIENIIRQLEAERRAEDERRLADLERRAVHAHPTTRHPMI